MNNYAKTVVFSCYIQGKLTHEPGRLKISIGGMDLYRQIPTTHTRQLLTRGPVEWTRSHRPTGGQVVWSCAVSQQATRLPAVRQRLVYSNFKPENHQNRRWHFLTKIAEKSTQNRIRHMAIDFFGLHFFTFSREWDLDTKSHARLYEGISCGIGWGWLHDCIRAYRDCMRVQ